MPKTEPPAKRPGAISSVLECVDDGRSRSSRGLGFGLDLRHLFVGQRLRHRFERDLEHAIDPLHGDDLEMVLRADRLHR